MCIARGFVQGLAMEVGPWSCCSRGKFSVAIECVLLVDLSREAGEAGV
jgi:hypothetical protein